MEVDKESLKGHIETIILSLLSKRDLYGYEIVKMVRIETENAFELKEGTLYLSLKRLEKRNFIVSYWSNEEGAGARRKYYHMTDHGHIHYKWKVNEWAFVRSLIDKFVNYAPEEKDEFS